MIKRISTGDEFDSNLFKQWFNETGIQWEPPAPNIPAQNGVVERGMYIVIKPFRNVLKLYHIPTGFWNIFIEVIVYILNRIII